MSTAAHAGDALRLLLADRRRLEARLAQLREVAAQLRSNPAMLRSAAGLDAAIAALDSDLAHLAESIHVTSAHMGTATALRTEQLLLVRCDGTKFAIPVAAIAEVRQWPDASLPHATNLASVLGAGGTTPSAGCALVLNDGRALLVDEIVQQDELEVRSLGPVFAEMNFYSGAALAAGEEVVLVVDPAALAG